MPTYDPTGVEDREPFGQEPWQRDIPFPDFTVAMRCELHDHWHDTWRKDAVEELT